MEDWVKVLLLVAALAVVYKATSHGQRFVSGIHTATPGPSMGTSLEDATGLPLTEAVSGMPLPNGCQAPAPVDTDLIPKPCVGGNNDFSDLAPNPSALAKATFLDPTKFIGADTIQGSLRNSSYDIRSQPPVPKCPNAWGPVYQSTIQADPWRKTLDCPT